MGQPDLYPFVLSAPVIEKLAFIHGIVLENAGITPGVGPQPKMDPPPPLPVDGREQDVG